MAQPPKLTEEQRKQALAKAAEARRVRAEAKELLKTGSMRISELFARAESDDLILKLISPLRPGLIQSGDDGGFMYLVMPIRLNV